MPLSSSRPRDVPALRDRLSRLHSPESLAVAEAFTPVPSDVFISPYPKSGTTWLQQVVHGLRTGGDMDFAEIGAVVPWLETCLDLGLDPEAPQAGGFRAFKSHWSGDRAPVGPRYIVALRAPGDVLLSFYRFLEGWMFEAGSIDLETFARELFFMGSHSGRYWEHLASWWARRREPEVLLLSFEAMLADLPHTVARIAAHLDIPLTPDLQARVVAQSRADFMGQHGRQFDDHLLRDARNAACGLPPGGLRGKVVGGRAGEGARALTPEILRALDAHWAEIVAPATGCAHYEALRAQLKEEGRDVV